MNNMKSQTLIFAYFECVGSRHDRLSIYYADVDLEFVYNWVAEQRKAVEEKVGESAVLVNFKVETKTVVL